MCIRDRSHDADDAEELEDVVVLLHVRQNAVEVERQSRDEVDYVHRCARRTTGKFSK